MWLARERRGKCTGFWWEKPAGKRPLERPTRRWMGSEWSFRRLAEV
jgi:hypothetical protein